MMTTATYQHHPGGGMPPGMHVQGMGPGGPNPNLGQPMHMMPGVGGPNGPHVGHGGPMMGGMQPGMGGGMHGQPNAASMAQAHLNPQQQQQVLQQQAAAQAYQMQQHRMRAQQMAAAQQQLQQGQPNGMPMGFPGAQNNFTPQQIAQMQHMNQMRQMQMQQAQAAGVPHQVNLPPHLMQQQAQLQQQQQQQQHQQQQQQAAHAHAQQQHQQQQQQLQQQMQQAMQQSGQQAGNSGPPVSQPQQGPQQPTQQGPMRPPSQMSNAREAQPSPAPPATPQQPQPQSQQQPMQGHSQAPTPNPQQQQPQPPQPGNPQQQIGQGPQSQNPQAQATAQQPNAQLRTQMQLAQSRQQAGQQQQQQQQQQMQMAMAAANNQAMRGDKTIQGKVSGLGILRVLQFAHHLGVFRASSEEFTNDIGYWQNFVSRFFMEGVGTFNYTVLDKDNNTKRFEIAYAALPRFFYTQFAGDVQSMEFVANEPSESSVPLSSETCVQCGNARLIYWFLNGTQLVCNGRLQVLLEGEKIQALEFVTSSQQQFVPMEKLKELFAQKSPTHPVKQSPKLVKTQAKRHNQNRQQPPEPTIELGDIPVVPVGDFYITKRVQALLEVGETIFNMTDLINHYVQNPNQTPSQALQDVIRQPQQPMQQMMPNMPNMHPALGGQMPPGVQQQNFMSPHLQQRGIPGMVGSPAGMHTPSPNAHILAQQQGTSSSTASANTSPNVNNKRRRPSAVKEEPDGGGEQKVKQSPRVGGNKRLKQQ